MTLHHKVSENPIYSSERYPREIHHITYNHFYIFTSMIYITKTKKRN